MKQEKYEFIQRIPSHYVGDDCVQVMMPHYLNRGITILNSDGMIYHYKPNSNLYINKYISDERKNNFPYSKIPLHQDRRLFKKIEMINQLLNFGKVYLKFADGMLVEGYALKDANEALVAMKFLLPNEEKSKIMTREEVKTLMSSFNGGMFDLGGGKVDRQLMSEEEILEWYKEKLIEKEQIQQETNTEYDDEVSRYFLKSISYLTINDLNIKVTIDDFIGVYIENNEIKNITGIVINFIGTNRYRVEFYDFPVTIYTIDHMKHLEQQNFINTKEPRISKFLNRNIDKEIIKKEKEKVHSLVKKKR